MWGNTVNSAVAMVSGGTAMGSGLLSILEAEDIEPGSEPSYQLCKKLYLLHPLGAKMAEAPIKMAQSQPRVITVQDSPKEVTEEFERVFGELGCAKHILNFRSLARVYGVSSLVLGCEGRPTDQPLDMTRLWELPIFFNVFDPLNMSGSVTANQVPNRADFNQVAHVVVSGKTYHRSRWQVAMNEEPIYIAYTNSAFGFTGRSVYQRALYPMKSYLKTMIANDAIAGKLALLVAKMKAPGGVINKVMQVIAAMKRKILRAATNGEVATIDVQESIETLNMQNVDGAGEFARSNILKDCATAANMPAKLLANETMIGGMAEGTEDAKNIAKYIDGERLELQSDYNWFDNIVRYRAWMSPAFFKRMQDLYPEAMSGKTHESAFFEWCRAFKATWPSMLVEPPGELAKGEAVKFEAMVAVAEMLLPQIDPDNKVEVVSWLCDNLSQIKTLLPHDLNLDLEALKAHFKEQKGQQDEMRTAGLTAQPGADDRERNDSVARVANMRQRVGGALRLLASNSSASAHA